MAGAPERIAVGNGAAELIASLLRFTEGMIGIIEPTASQYSERAGIDRVVGFTTSSERIELPSPQNDITFTLDEIN